MRDTRSLLLLLVSLLLVAVSFVLIWTWGYSYYNRKDEIKTVAAVPDTNAIAEKIRDSLQKAYSATLKELDQQLDSTLSNSDSLRSQLNVKLAEFYRLRDEINALLNNRTGNNNYAVAKQKIGELQTKVDDLKDKYSDVENENKKLASVIEQMKSTVPNPVAVKTSNQTKPASTYNNLSQPFTATDLKLSAVMQVDENEVETNLAEKTDKLNGSFSVMNYNSQLTNAEMMVVVLKPDGRVLRSSAWDSGTFNTEDGKKIYSYKLSFSYSRGESKRLLFSLKGGSLVKGNYTMEVYHNGQLIGKMVKTLS